MSETPVSPALASYRDEVTELMEAGEPIGREGVIEELAELDLEVKA